MQISTIHVFVTVAGFALVTVASSQNVTTTATPKETIKVGYLGAVLGTHASQFVVGGLVYAIEEIKNDSSLLPNFDFEIIRGSTGFNSGDELESIKGYTNLGVVGDSIERPHVVFGPDFSCTVEARIAAAWKQPMISYGCSENAVSDKEIYPTFARTYPTDALYANSILAVLLEFNWDYVSIINGLDPEFKSTSSRLLQLFGDYNITVQNHIEFEARYSHSIKIRGSETIFDDIIEKTYETTRIYILLCLTSARSLFMGKLQERGLLQNGEYMVVSTSQDIYEINEENPYLDREDIWENYPIISKIDSYQSLLLLVPRPPPDPVQWQEFEEKVRIYRTYPPFNLRYSNAKVAVSAAYLYDAMYVYARALQEVLDEGGSITDGKAIISKAFRQTYTSATGIEQYMDENGDVGANLTLLSLQPANYSPGYDMAPVANFDLYRRMNMYNNASVVEVEYVPIDNMSIHWPSGFPPIAIPDCGFYDDLCPKPVNYTKEITGSVLGFLLLVVIIVVTVVYRNWKYEQELASLIWKIDYKEIKFNTNINASQYSLGSRMSMASLGSAGSGTRMPAQIFTTVGTYRGQLVAIQKINKKNVDITRAVRKEFKMLRDMRNDNINPFVGACVDAPNICSVTEYCSRGSLQDILENDDINLDNMFKAALVGDLLKGMIYLHNSPLKSHGNLKSSNCVIDSRWVLKITGYGLHAFKEGAKKYSEDIGEHALYQSQLWTAPELLRMDKAPPCGTQKGDIYSLGIILYEIALRQGPFGNCIHEPREIIDRVKFPRNPQRPYRPVTSTLLENDVADALIKTMTACWAEEPDSRPDIKEARLRLKSLQKGLKSNIFDNMIQIMEKYANNLESIVEDRTKLLVEEKKKTDLLLHSMLPKSVANQLKRGNKVEAEEFEGVTIYFSDIVGFTKLSSESTPWQVIDLLNDLYTLFDAIIKNYDAYKVETIGDAYMLVSGLPVRNGDKHAGEIASASLHILDGINKFTVRHKPDYKLKLRIGIHSGSVCAGVVGLTMPRYCLFGDTVNTASRMESNGEPLKIHCSPQCRDVLLRLGGYQLKERGLVAMKGKGEILTYWLEGQNPAYRRESKLSPDEFVIEPIREDAGDDGTMVEDLEGGADKVDEQQTETTEQLTQPPVEVVSSPSDVVTTVDETRQQQEKQAAWAPVSSRTQTLPPIEEPMIERPDSAPSSTAPPNTPVATEKQEAAEVDETDLKSKKKKKKKKKKDDKAKKDDDVLEIVGDERRISTDSRSALLPGESNGKVQRSSEASEQIPLIDVIAPGATISQPAEVNDTDTDRTKQKDSLTDSGVGNSREGSNHEVPMS